MLAALTRTQRAAEAKVVQEKDAAVAMEATEKARIREQDKPLSKRRRWERTALERQPAVSLVPEKMHRKPGGNSTNPEGRNADREYYV